MENDYSEGWIINAKEDGVMFSKFKKVTNSWGHTEWRSTRTGRHFSPTQAYVSSGYNVRFNIFETEEEALRVLIEYREEQLNNVLKEVVAPMLKTLEKIAGGVYQINRDGIV